MGNRSTTTDLEEVGTQGLEEMSNTRTTPPPPPLDMWDFSVCWVKCGQSGIRAGAKARQTNSSHLCWVEAVSESLYRNRHREAGGGAGGALGGHTRQYTETCIMQNSWFVAISDGY